MTTNEPLLTTVESLDRAASDIDCGVAGMTVSQVRDAVHDAKMAHVLKAAHEAAIVAMEATEKRAAIFESTANSLRDELDRLGAAAEKIYGDSEHGWTFGEAISNLVEDAAKWKAQSSLTDHKYLNPICGQDGCQWLVAKHQTDVYRKQMADDAYRFMQIETYCRKHLHSGVSPGKQEACGEILKMMLEDQ